LSLFKFTIFIMIIIHLFQIIQFYCTLFLWIFRLLGRNWNVNISIIIFDPFFQAFLSTNLSTFNMAIVTTYLRHINLYILLRILINLFILELIKFFLKAWEGINVEGLWLSISVFNFYYFLRLLIYRAHFHTCHFRIWNNILLRQSWLFNTLIHQYLIYNHLWMCFSSFNCLLLRYLDWLGFLNWWIVGTYRLNIIVYWFSF